MADLAISAESRRMRFKVGTYGKPGPPLAVTLRAPGYTARSGVRSGFEDNSSLQVALPAPPGGRLATVCIRNDGQHRVAFYAAGDSARSRVHATVNGKREHATPTLSFAEARPVSIAQRAGVTAGRIAVFRGLLDHAWVVWLLAGLMLAGVPLLVAAGLAASARQLRNDSSAE
jgi:hypothetical protein